MSSILQRQTTLSLPNWLVDIRLPEFLQPASQKDREIRRAFIKEAFKRYGVKAPLLLSAYEAMNLNRRIRKAVRLSGPKPEPVSPLFMREWFGLGLVLAIGSCVALSGNTKAVAPVLPKIAIVKSASVFFQTEILGNDIESRPELGSYADPDYRYPHLRIETGTAKPVPVTFTAFNGKEVGRGMYSRYLGVQGKIPSATTVNASNYREQMFRLKFAHNPDSTPVARSMQGQYAQMYNTQRTYMSLAQFVQGVEIVNKEAIASIDFDGLCADSRLKLNDKSCDLLRTLVGQTTAVEQVTYALTELLPKDRKYHGVFNAWVFDHGLRSYGREFWDTVPAGGDPLASGGSWQFTSKAVGAYVDKVDGPQVGFATIVSRHASLKVPESFLDFKRVHHERAALYFRIANTAFLVRDAAKDPRTYATLNRVALGGHGQDMLAFVATSHHAQNKVRKDFAMPWLRDGAKRPFTTYLRGRFKEYGERTLTNFPGLKSYLRDPALAVASLNKGQKS